MFLVCNILEFFFIKFSIIELFYLPGRWCLCRIPSSTGPGWRTSLGPSRNQTFLHGKIWEGMHRCTMSSAQDSPSRSIPSAYQGTPTGVGRRLRGICAKSQTNQIFGCRDGYLPRCFLNLCLLLLEHKDLVCYEIWIFLLAKYEDFIFF